MTSALTIVFDLIALAVLTLLIATFDQQRRRRSLRHPPGPPALPILGNLFDVPRESSWLTYTEWAKVYGDITSVQVLGKTLVILNSARVAREILERKAAVYSGRPSIPFFKLQWDWFVVTSDFTHELRLRRKMLDRGLRPNVAVQYRSMQKSKTHDFLKHLSARPGDFRRHIEHLQGAIILSLVYGYDVKEENDTYLQTALDANEIAQRTLLPGSVLVNDMPFLQYLPEWFPGTGFKALAREGTKIGLAMVNDPFDFVKQSMMYGAAQLSVTRECLLDLEKTDASNPEDIERAIAAASGSLYLAGADSTVSAILTLFLALILHPEVQQKAQAELDAVTGRGRLPDYSDRTKLPYVDAVCKEVLRWRNVAPAGVPHSAAQDDVYEGYFIPKGATVIANIWAILHDPRVYPEPDLFNPERFLTPDGQSRDDPTLGAVFGFGKRICPGRHVAESTLFIVAASFLATYTIGKAKDAEGMEIPVGSEYTGIGLISYPEEFKCSIVPRSAEAEELIAMESQDTE
ncbi:cytochrome P450 [Artomyces pyxidatus]|uniref:Cytochrome P450 n=1 Tax=Artomyces pyxidatus TaxID=48021 RepID=A0ACB8TDT9_9AGAM|nr:cytochrome P450 [Artomyces pyxidatus]